MKVKELPEETNIVGLHVRIPDHVFNSGLIQLSGIPQQDVYIAGSIMNDFFVSTISNKTKGKRRVYPLMGMEDTLLDWDIID